MKSLNHLKNLKVLDLSFCKNITLSGIHSIQNSSFAATLLKLNLRYCSSIGGDKVIDIPKHLNSLKSLDLSWCYKVKEEQIGLLKTKFPSIKDVNWIGISPPPPEAPVTESNLTQSRAKRYLRRDGFEAKPVPVATEGITLASIHANEVKSNEKDDKEESKKDIIVEKKEIKIDDEKKDNNSTDQQSST